ncbi:MAG: hypothetical protein ACPGVV_01880 [Croceimicrobium sp.]
MSIPTFLALSFFFFLAWSCLFFSLYFAGKFLFGARAIEGTSHLLNLLDTLILEVYGLIFILNYFLFKLWWLNRGFYFLLASVLAFYLADGLFQFLKRPINWSHVMHHSISIGGVFWMSRYPNLHLEACLLLMFAQITFQYPILSLLRIFRWTLPHFEYQNAFWLWHLFLLMRGFVIPIFCAWVIYKHQLDWPVALFLGLLNLWGFILIPNVKRFTHAYLNK